MHIPPALLSGLADDSEELLYDLLCFAAGLYQLEGDIQPRQGEYDCSDTVRDRARYDGSRCRRQDYCQSRKKQS